MRTFPGAETTVVWTMPVIGAGSRQLHIYTYIPRLYNSKRNWSESTLVTLSTSSLKPSFLLPAGCICAPRTSKTELIANGAFARGTVAEMLGSNIS